ncbi:YtxH domain-containing protein [Larkinella rosea]|uniref:YtxH domain-containing protein n=1 Tax=Larkinella rosea TaxID=2025312 RepID=A0A3P1BIR2_9BACT|nr:YtxH domain-containing protein [Larkinella rosea]RRB00786.1 YtxH domain-containing protein [Larkinella rosea]
MKSSRDFLLGFITGVVAGILTAPKSGQESRQWIQDEADKRTKDLQDQWSKGVEQVKSQVEQVKSQVNQWTGKLQNEGEEKKQQFNDTVETAADKAHDGVDAAKKSIKVD